MPQRRSEGGARLKRFFPTRSQAMRSMLRLAEKVVDHSVNILIIGETGVGKDYLAQSIHSAGPRRGKPFLHIDCAAIPSELFESELFGYEAGAFTDAKNRKRGKLEEATGGTLYLDEIASLSPSVQPKLLRAVQEREFQRLGGGRTIKFDLRITASTTTALQDLADQGVVRSDLFFRLNVVSLAVPPLRERREDIPMLVKRFVAAAAHAIQRDISVVTAEAMERLQSYSWPGNIRQLKNVIDRAVVLETSSEITASSLTRELFGTDREIIAIAGKEEWTLDQLERSYIASILLKSGNNYSEAARILGINRKTLLEKRRKFGLDHPERPPTPETSGEESGGR